MRQPFTALALAALLTTPLFAADKKDSKKLITDPAKAGADYAVQGEYLGKVETDDGVTRIGVQVIALGGGKFASVSHVGGLPGDGWKKGEMRVKSEGELKDGVAHFTKDGWKGEIKDGVMTLTDPNGKQRAELKKIVRKSPTLGKKPPAGAVVLFDGTTADNFKNGKIVMKNLLLANCESKRKFGDHTLHLEFRTPFKPYARGQARGNSGMYIQSRYEVQVLDSFGLEGKNNECGGIYSIAEPLVNMCFPPLTWQTYDYDFTAARYDDKGNKVKNARVTIRHNGVVIHKDLELPHGTPGKKPEKAGPEALYLQGHGNPVVYRNIWVIEK